MSQKDLTLSFVGSLVAVRRMTQSLNFTIEDNQVEEMIFLIPCYPY